MDITKTPAVESRKERMTVALGILRSKNGIKFQKAVALLSYNLGVTERKAKEYISTLVEIDGIKRDGDFIVKKGK